MVFVLFEVQWVICQGGWWNYQLAGKPILGDIIIVRFGRSFLIFEDLVQKCGVFRGREMPETLTCMSTQPHIQNCIFEDLVQLVIHLGEGFFLKLIEIS